MTNTGWMPFWHSRKSKFGRQQCPKARVGQNGHLKELVFIISRHFKAVGDTMMTYTT